MIEPRRREGHEGRSLIKSVGIGIIHLSILLLCALCALCGLIIQKQL